MNCKKWLLALAFINVSITAQIAASLKNRIDVSDLVKKIKSHADSSSAFGTNFLTVATKNEGNGVLDVDILILTQNVYLNIHELEYKLRQEFAGQNKYNKIMLHYSKEISLK